MLTDFLLLPIATGGMAVSLVLGSLNLLGLLGQADTGPWTAITCAIIGASIAAIVALIKLVPNRPLTTRVIATTKPGESNGPEVKFAAGSNDRLSNAFAEVLNVNAKTALDSQRALHEERKRQDERMLLAQSEMISSVKVLWQQMLADYNTLRDEANEDNRSWRNRSMEDQRQWGHWQRNVIQIMAGMLNLQGIEIPLPPKHHEVKEQDRERLKHPEHLDQPQRPL